MVSNRLAWFVGLMPRDEHYLQSHYRRLTRSRQALTTTTYRHFGSDCYGGSSIRTAICRKHGQTNTRINDATGPLDSCISTYRAQGYIGGKVRQAERLRAWAKTRNQPSHRSTTRWSLTKSALDFTKRLRKAASTNMTERLDPHFYPAVVEQYLKGSSGHLSALRLHLHQRHQRTNTTRVHRDRSVLLAKSRTFDQFSSTFLKGHRIKVKDHSLQPDRLLPKHEPARCAICCTQQRHYRLAKLHTGTVVEFLPSTRGHGSSERDRDRCPVLSAFSALIPPGKTCGICQFSQPDSRITSAFLPIGRPPARNTHSAISEDLQDSPLSTSHDRYAQRFGRCDISCYTLTEAANSSSKPSSKAKPPSPAHRRPAGPGCR